MTLEIPRPLEIILVILLFGLALWARLPGLDRFATADEPYWVTRSANFYYAIGQRDFAATFQREHPGVTTMWAGTFGMLLEFPEYRGTGVGQIDIDTHESVFAEFGHQAKDVLAAGRLFVVLGIVSALAISYLYARRLFGVPAALAGYALLLLDPFYIGLGRLLHTDAIQATTMLLSALAFLYFLLQGRKTPHLLLSAVAGGLAWLTKSPGLFLLPFLALILLIDLLQQLREPDHPALGRLLWGSIWPFLLWGMFAGLTFWLLWPAMWVQPLDSLKRVIDMGLLSSSTGHTSPMFFNGERILSGSIGLEYWYYYPLTFLWRTTPLILLGLALAAAGFVFKLAPFDRAAVRRTIVALLLYAFFYGIMVTISTKKGDRYFLPASVMLDLIAGAGWGALGLFIAARVHERWRSWVNVGLISLVLAVSALYALPTRPYYLSYYNPLLGGGRRAPEVMSIGWGEGLDQAARYLNELPEPENQVVTVWYDVGPFSYYYDGQTRYIPIVETLDLDRLERLLKSDYAVIYIHQWQRDIPDNLLDILAKETPVYTVMINDIAYAQIYDLHNGALIPAGSQ
ncbi:MAG: glycosyltransferase family 39 protein [Anaerolineales bacterium]|jgi:hypothetical protein